LLFIGAQGATLRPGNLRYRVVIPAAERAGVPCAVTRCGTPAPLCEPTNSGSAGASLAQSAARRAVDLAHLGRAPHGRPRLLRVAVLVAFGAIAWSAAIWRTRRRIIQ
jgi:hypothetical protein